MKFAVHPLGPLLFLSMALMPVQSKAQDPNTNAADRALESQQRTLEQRAIDGELQRQLDLRDTQRMPAPAVLPAPRSVGEEPQVAYAIERIVLDDDDAPSAGSLAVLRRYEGRSLTLNDVVDLVKELNDDYASRGFVTTIVTLPGQNLASGILHVQVVWGRISGITLNGEPLSGVIDKVRVEAALPGWQGQVLNIRQIDQLVENLSTTGKTATVEVKPADAPGASILAVQIQKQRVLSGSSMMDNSGSERRDGTRKNTLQLSVSDLLPLNDELSFGYGRRLFRRVPDKENSYNVSYRVPYGAWTTSLSYARVQTEQQFAARFGQYRNTGSLDDWRLRVGRVLARNQVGRTQVWAELGRKNNANFFEGQLIDVSSKPYSQLVLGMSHAFLAAGGAVYADLSWTRGVPWIQGEWKRPASDTAAQTRFQVLNSNLSWRRPDKLAGLSVVYNARAGLQYSNDRLLGKNKLYLGDENSVRGFKDTPISGDKGAYVSLGQDFPFVIDRYFVRTVTVRMGLDSGWARGNGPDASWQRLTGSVLGLDVSAGAFQWSAMWGFPLYVKPSQGQRDPVFYTSLSARF